jgi:hypothetical protein
VHDLLELEERWNVEDVDRANELLDGLDWAEAEAMRRATKVQPS